MSGCGCKNNSFMQLTQRVSSSALLGAMSRELWGAGLNRAAHALAAIQARVGDGTAARALASIGRSYVARGYGQDEAFAQIAADLDAAADPIAYVAPHIGIGVQPIAAMNTRPANNGHPTNGGVVPPGLPPPPRSDATGAPGTSCSRTVAPCVPGALCGVRLQSAFAIETSIATGGTYSGINGGVARLTRGTDMRELQNLGTLGQEAQRITAWQQPEETVTAVQPSVAGDDLILVPTLTVGKEAIGFAVKISSPGDASRPGSLQLGLSSAGAVNHSSEPIDRATRWQCTVPTALVFFVLFGFRYTDSDAASVYQTMWMDHSPVRIIVSGLTDDYAVQAALLVPGTDLYDAYWDNVMNFGLVTP